MPVLVEQDPNHAPGVARLRLAVANGLQADLLQIRITANIGGADRHLDPSASGDQAWSPTEKWFTGASVETAGAGLAVDLGPSATWHLKPYQPYEIAFRDGSGTVVEDRMSWIALRLPSDPPPPSATSGIASAGYPEKEPEQVSEPEPAPDPDPEVEDDPLAAFADMADAAEEPEEIVDPPKEETRNSPLWWIVLGALAVLAIVGLLVWFFVLQEEPDPEAEQSGPVQEEVVVEQDNLKPIPLTVKGARTYLKEQDPNGDDILSEARRFEEAGQHEAAFLLYKSAARKGSGPAALRMARYYDPVTHDAALGVVSGPDPEIAANWYEDAARAGELPAMERLGEMLKGGDVDRPDAPEQGVFWLNKAAEAGSEKARELLK